METFILSVINIAFQWIELSLETSYSLFLY